MLSIAQEVSCDIEEIYASEKASLLRNKFSRKYDEKYKLSGIKNIVKPDNINGTALDLIDEYQSKLVDACSGINITNITDKTEFSNTLDNIEDIVLEFKGRATEIMNSDYTMEDAINGTRIILDSYKSKNFKGKVGALGRAFIMATILPFGIAKSKRYSTKYLKDIIDKAEAGLINDPKEANMLLEDFDKAFDDVLIEVTKMRKKYLK